MVPDGPTQQSGILPFCFELHKDRGEKYMEKFAEVKRRLSVFSQSGGFRIIIHPLSTERLEAVLFLCDRTLENTHTQLIILSTCI